MVILEVTLRILTIVLSILIGWSLANVSFINKLNKAHNRTGELLHDNAARILDVGGEMAKNMDKPAGKKSVAQQKQEAQKDGEILEKLIEEKFRLGIIQGRLDFVQEVR